jgi:hypothetical protein
MNNRYLTDLAKQRRAWHIPVGFLSALFTIIAVEVWAEDSPVGEDFFIWLAAHITVVVFMLLPLLFILRWRRRQRDARVIAEKLARRKETAIPLDKLPGVLGVRKANVKVADLKHKGFLQRIEIENGALLLDNPAQKAAVEAPDGDVIQQIRRLNDEIDDAAVSERIDRIEKVTAGILRTLQERPDRADDARRFMSYYLPTTLKLLESYRLMEKQSYQGENIQAARHRIEAVLDKLVTAAERQQDKLFDAEAMDVEAEINVLETMMASAGLMAKKA